MAGLLSPEETIQDGVAPAEPARRLGFPLLVLVLVEAFACVAWESIEIYSSVAHSLVL